MIEVRVPDEQEGTKAVVRAWLKQVGDAVAENDPLVELETDKVTQEVPAPAAGVLAEILLDTDAEAVPGALLGRIDRRIREPSAWPGGEAEARRQQRLPALLDPGLRRRTRSRRASRPSVRRALPAARHRPVAHPGHRPQRADHARGCRPRGRRRDHGQRRRAGDRPAAPLLRAATSRTTGCG